MPHYKPLVPAGQALESQPVPKAKVPRVPYALPYPRVRLQQATKGSGIADGILNLG